MSVTRRKTGRKGKATAKAGRNESWTEIGKAKNGRQKLDNPVLNNEEK
jgi:hypothetical protein